MPKTPVKAKKPKPRRKSVTLTVVGLQYRLTVSTRRMISEKLKNGPITCNLVREPDNAHDSNAIKVVIADSPYKGIHLGYLKKEIALVFADAMDQGEFTDTEARAVSLDPLDGTAEVVFRYRKSPGKPKKRKT